MIWSNSKYLMLHMVALFQVEQRCCNRKSVVLCNFKGEREVVAALIKLGNLYSKDFLFRPRVGTNQHISTRQYNRIFHGLVEKLGLEDSLYSKHSMRRTKHYLIYKKTKNLWVIQFLLGHKKLESTVRYLGIKVDDALELSELIEV